MSLGWLLFQAFGQGNGIRWRGSGSLPLWIREMTRAIGWAPLSFGPLACLLCGKALASVHGCAGRGMGSAVARSVQGGRQRVQAWGCRSFGSGFGGLLCAVLSFESVATSLHVPVCFAARRIHDILLKQGQAFGIGLVRCLRGVGIGRSQII